MATVYRIAYVSQETRGSGKPNVIELDFASDADAVTFGLNGGAGVTAGNILSAQNTSCNHEYEADYSLPYPAGTETSLRAALWDATGGTMQLALANTPAGFVENTRAAALIASGILIVWNNVVQDAPVSCNIQTFGLTPSV